MGATTRRMARRAGPQASGGAGRFASPGSCTTTSVSPVAKAGAARPPVILQRDAAPSLTSYAWEKARQDGFDPRASFCSRSVAVLGHPGAADREPALGVGLEIRDDARQA